MIVRLRFDAGQPDRAAADMAVGAWEPTALASRTTSAKCGPSPDPVSKRHAGLRQIIIAFGQIWSDHAKPICGS